MEKKIIGIDLGVTSIGWAYVIEDENGHSRILRIGTRVNPLTTEELKNFEQGKPITETAERTLKRSMRRNLQRYKQRRTNLINVLLKNKLITETTALAEDGKGTTHLTHALRAKAAYAQIPLEDFARVLLMLNKKRGYRSSRKVKTEADGQAIDGMAVAKKLYEENITPGQLCYTLLLQGKKTLPDFYRSDLQVEMEKVWTFQKQFHQAILTDEFRKYIAGKGQRATAASFWGKYGFNTAEFKGSREEKKLKSYEWRSQAITTPLSQEEVAAVITDINSNIANSSGYLGAISDRSKELFFNKQTVGQYQYNLLQQNPHTNLSGQVFYRQDYLDEFETIWETQATFHTMLTPSLKEEIRDIVIFYQRKLKSQKKLVSICEFEKRILEPLQGDKVVGYKVAPKSSPLFQEFKIWQALGRMEIQHKVTKERHFLDLDAKQLLFDELNVKGDLTKENALTILGFKPKEWECNLLKLEGNRTNQALYEAYLKILELEGYEVKDLLGLKLDKDDIKLSELPVDAADIKKMVREIFETLNIKTSLLDFNATLPGKSFEQQHAYQLWHLLYSYEGDNSPSGNKKLQDLLQAKFGFTNAHGQILANVSLETDYGSLSAKAIRKIFTHIKENHYSAACALAGYNHSSYLSKEENEQRILKDRLTILPKNSLRNPVVEKILNQLINLLNTIFDDPYLGKPDEIRIELARELKKNVQERQRLNTEITKNNTEHERITKILIKEDNIKNPTRNDIIRYKLYQELKHNGYKTLYSNTYIPREELFGKNFDIEHIIPQSILFDDSFSNKTLCVRKENIDKADRTAMDFIGPYFGEDKVQEYINRVEMLHQINLKNPEEGIGKGKYKKLLMKASEIGQGFIERDLRDTQYIAKKARQMLLEVTRTVVATTGSITKRLREDWGLVNVMQELNMDKYRQQGLTELIEKKDGSTKERITDWTKRNDHRHHAMDALTIAFTKHSHIQYLNNLNARKSDDKKGKEIFGIEQKETEKVKDDTGQTQRRFKLPMPDFRQAAKHHLEHLLISFKAKNKVFTKNKNKYKTKNGEQVKLELTPRGQLHKETIYGRIKKYVTHEEKVSSKFNAQLIQTVANSKYRYALLKRLEENGNDPKKAFTGKNSLDKTPLFVDATQQEKIPPVVKLVSIEQGYTIRKDITPENFKDAKSIEKIVDVGIRNLLHHRLETYNGNEKEAFYNLDKNPIWVNESKGICIKRVTITGVTNAEPLHYKRDHHGKPILDNNGNRTPADFVSTGNNHHAAIYRDAAGNLQDNVVSFYEAVARVNQGLPIIDKSLNKELGWQFLFSLKQNECFVFPNEGFDPLEIDLYNPANNKLIAANLFRVQNFSRLQYGNNIIRDYNFRHIYETSVENRKELKDIAYKQVKSLPIFEKIIKVRINHIGQIVKTGEY
ncbi:CRISPR-associated endonuclease Csn1 [Chitinophaga costaii]|uniref:CRISPR-associated endonuclease Cas9 n=1 Tax=Chitinophaga costaii TaxID=1335309 RepID=A0A1C4DJV4_9BACT|nr:type II CRISPR RNA-guided endonuclease Cas9 [Chitinophaga costaii]PUZ24666.1 type II CRISPR RNA-guided endonuclease Cas9 [Chitinophaga costaii]SCC31520.1 CRISPR-associated endonuclease Csn1 [Chitinophaga costaii]